MRILARILEKIIGPIIVGLVVLGGQFVIQPIIAEKSLIKQEIWKAKFDAHSERIVLLNQYLASRKWYGSGMSADFISKPLNEIERKLLEGKFRDNFGKTLLLTSKPEIVKKYFIPLKDTTIIPTDYLKYLINLFREDLGMDTIHIDPVDVLFILQLPRDKP